ncbi:hypothetical protein L195_g054957 [Trifolium pratense]|uniref:Uncharacterized protein n=1 Tax=Trifolium pratense TaxID=57577 RepID=A0A2K3KIT8_TRIPR|nr:hypothetical protein L195_g054957 [Trifolium pratense]
MVEAHVKDEGKECAEALKWEAEQRHLNPIGGAHAMYRQQLAMTDALNVDIENLNINIGNLNQQVEQRNQQILQLQLQPGNEQNAHIVGLTNQIATLTAQIGERDNRIAELETENQGLRDQNADYFFNQVFGPNPEP